VVTGMLVCRASKLLIMLLWSGDKCCTTTNAAPVLGAHAWKNFSSASKPPADAPMHTKWLNEWLAGGAGWVIGATVALNSDYILNTIVALHCDYFSVGEFVKNTLRLGTSCITGALEPKAAKRLDACLRLKRRKAWTMCLRMFVNIPTSLDTKPLLRQLETIRYAFCRC